MIGYKVVFAARRSACPALRSLFALGLCCVTYEVGKPTVPHEDCGPLCVFEDAKTARAYRRVYGPGAQLYECEYEPSSHRTIWNYCQHMPLSSLPEGTRLASSVTLKERLRG